MYTEGWGLLDSIYWAVVTSSSVGYGDLTMENEMTRWLNTPYMLISVGGFAASLGRFGSIVIEIEAERAANAFVERGCALLPIWNGAHDGAGCRGVLITH